MCTRQNLKVFFPKSILPLLWRPRGCIPHPLSPPLMVNNRFCGVNSFLVPEHTWFTHFFKLVISLSYVLVNPPPALRCRRRALWAASEHAGGEQGHGASGRRVVRVRRALGQRRRALLRARAAAARAHHVRVRAIPLYLLHNMYIVIG